MCFHAFVELHFEEYSMFMRAGLPDDIKLLHALGPFYPPFGPATSSKQVPWNHSRYLVNCKEAVFLKNGSKDFLDFLHESSLL